MAVQRSIYLINSRFQLKFSVFATLIVLIPFALYPFIIYKLIDFSVTNCTTNSLAASLDQYQGKLIFFLIVQYLIYGVIIFIICIFLSHKIAGPLFKLRKYLDKLKSGQSTGHLFFRKGDNFQEIADAYNEVIDSMNEKQYQLAIQLESIKSKVEKGLHNKSDKDLIEVINDLDTLQNNYKG